MNENRLFVSLTQEILEERFIVSYSKFIVHIVKLYLLEKLFAIFNYVGITIIANDAFK